MNAVRGTDTQSGYRRGRMLRMDQVHVVRHKVLVEGQSVRRTAREMGLSRNTVKRYLDRPAPVRVEHAARARPVAEGVAPRIEALLAESPRWTGGKQRLTATRLHAMLRAEGHVVGVTLLMVPQKRGNLDHGPATGERRSERTTKEEGPVLIAPSLRRSSAGSRFDESHDSIVMTNFRALARRKWNQLGSFDAGNARRSSSCAGRATAAIDIAARGAAP